MWQTENSHERQAVCYSGASVAGHRVSSSYGGLGSHGVGTENW